MEEINNYLTRQTASFIMMMQKWLLSDEKIFLYNINPHDYKDGNIIQAFNCSHPEIFKDVVESHVEKTGQNIIDKRLLVVTDNENIPLIKKSFDSSDVFEVVSINKLKNFNTDTMFFFYPFRAYLKNENPDNEFIYKQISNVYKLVNLCRTNFALILGDKEWQFFLNKLKNVNTDFLHLKATKESMESYVQSVGFIELTYDLAIPLLIKRYNSLLKKISDSDGSDMDELLKHLCKYVIATHEKGFLKGSNLLDITNKYDISDKIEGKKLNEVISNFPIAERVVLNAFWNTLKGNYIEAYGLWKDLDENEMANDILNSLAKDGLLLDMIMANNKTDEIAEKFKSGKPLTDKEISYLEDAGKIMNNNLIGSSKELLIKIILDKIETLKNTIESSFGYGGSYNG